MFLVEKFKTSIDWVDLIIKAEKNFPDYEIFTEPNLEEVQNECEFIFYPIENYSDLEAVFKLDGKEDGSSIDVKYGKKTTTVTDTEQLFEFISQFIKKEEIDEHVVVDKYNQINDKVKSVIEIITESIEEDPTTTPIPENEDAPVSVEEAQDGENPQAVNGVYDLLMEIQKDELATVQKYNSMIVTCEAEGYEDIAKIIRHITDEENIHIGMVQAAAQSISTMAREVKKGEQETIDILNGEEVHD